MDWWDRPVVCLDTETTGLGKYGEDSIVQVALLAVAPNGKAVGDELVTLCQPTTPMGTQAYNVHGISYEQAMDEGRPMPEVLEELSSKLDQAFDRGFPLTIFNAIFDWPFLQTEYHRHDMSAMLPAAEILDPFLMAAAARRRRSGLNYLAQRLGVGEQEGYHDARHDAILTGRLLFALVDRYEWLRKPLPTYYDEQVKWAQRYPHRGMDIEQEIWPNGRWSYEMATKQLTLVDDWARSDVS